MGNEQGQRNLKEIFKPLTEESRKLREEIKKNTGTYCTTSFNSCFACCSRCSFARFTYCLTFIASRLPLTDDGGDPLPFPEEDEEGIKASFLKDYLPKELSPGTSGYYLGEEEIKLNPDTKDVEFMGETFKNWANLFTLVTSDGEGEEFNKALNDKKAFDDYARIIVKSNVLHRDGDYTNPTINQKLGSAKYPKYNKLLKHIWFNRFSYMTEDELNRSETMKQMANYQKSQPKRAKYTDKTREL